MFVKDDPLKLTLSILFMSFKSCLACSLRKVVFGEQAFFQFSGTFPIHQSIFNENLASGAVGNFSACSK